ncbi:cell division protein FtsQ/DivIB [Anaeromyxobacter paludicola]|uniref:cell division protein FtsQ/DivIB n=1 Tax=Anaeromyxobacter paludicola TaxID=2918171 RepID=UPI0020BF7093|nr:FtsQ-type POTRA domain-containing protein [Anaeromyxobacter paludicola]
MDWRVARGGNRKRRDAAAESVSWKLRLRRAGIGLAALGACAATAGAARGAYRFLTAGQPLRIREVRFAGQQRASEQDLAEAATVRRGDNLLRADLGQLERALARVPWVKRAEAHRRVPAAVEVRIEEHQPAALIELSGLYLVSSEGDVFKRAAPGDGLDLPIVTGIAREDFVQRPAEVRPQLQGALALARTYAAAGLAEGAPISEIHLEADQGVTLYVGAEGTEVRLGTGDLPQKLSRLQKVLGALAATGSKPQVLHLDNRAHPSWVTIRLAGAKEALSKTGPRGP